LSLLCGEIIFILKPRKILIILLISLHLIDIFQVICIIPIKSWGFWAPIRWWPWTRCLNTLNFILNHILPIGTPRYFYNTYEFDNHYINFDWLAVLKYCYSGDIILAELAKNNSILISTTNEAMISIMNGPLYNLKLRDHKKIMNLSIWWLVRTGRWFFFFWYFFFSQNKIRLHEIKFVPMKLNSLTPPPPIWVFNSFARISSVKEGFLVHVYNYVCIIFH
jgi:hypothetical protein